MLSNKQNAGNHSASINRKNILLLHRNKFLFLIASDILEILYSSKY